MDNKKDPMERIIAEDLLNEAESIDKEINQANVEQMPEDLKEKLKQRLHEQIDEYEKERVYAQLSEEDKKALELGREMLKKSASLETEEKVVRRRKRKRVYVAAAAVAVLVLAMGITSIGGAERIIEMIGIMVGEREVVQVNTDEDNYIVKTDKEEEAYQEIKDVFGVDPVKPTHWPEGTVFFSSEIDMNLQVANLLYDCDGNIIQYFMSSHYTENSYGIDVEDKLLDQYYMKSSDVEIEIKEYETKELKIKRYSARYTYNGMDYFLIGTMKKENFIFLVKNLKFF